MLQVQKEERSEEILDDPTLEGQSRDYLQDPWHDLIRSAELNVFCEHPPNPDNQAVILGGGGANHTHV